MEQSSLFFNKFTAFYRAWRFIAVYTTARFLSSFWATSIQSSLLHPISWRFVSILSYLRKVFRVDLVPQISPPKPRVQLTCPPHAPQIPHFSFSISSLDEYCQPWSSSLRNLLQSPVTSSVLSPNIFNKQWDFSAKYNANGQKKKSWGEFRVRGVTGTGSAH